MLEPAPETPPPTPFRQLALQGAAVIIVLSLAWPYFGWKAEAMPWRETSLAIGGVAFAFATLSRQPWPWRIVHAVFMPLAWLLYPTVSYPVAG